MRYEDIDWNNVESATATEAGLQLTYKTPPVGVGQTQVVPLELQGTPEQAEEFNARFGGGAAFVGQTMADPRTYRPLVYRPVGPGSAPLRSPSGSYGQVGPMVEKHNVLISTKLMLSGSGAQEVSVSQHEDVLYELQQYKFSSIVFSGPYMGGVTPGTTSFNSFWQFVCGKICMAGKINVPIWVYVDGMQAAGFTPGAIQPCNCAAFPQPSVQRQSPPGSYALAGTGTPEGDGDLGQTRVVQYGGPIQNELTRGVVLRTSPPGSYGQVQPMAEQHQIMLKSPDSSRSNLEGFFWLLGTFFGPVTPYPGAPAMSTQLRDFICAWKKQHPQVPAAMQVFVDGKPFGSEWDALTLCQQFV